MDNAFVLLTVTLYQDLGGVLIVIYLYIELLHLMVAQFAYALGIFRMEEALIAIFPHLLDILRHIGDCSPFRRPWSGIGCWGWVYCRIVIAYLIFRRQSLELGHIVGDVPVNSCLCVLSRIGIQGWFRALILLHEVWIAPQGLLNLLLLLQHLQIFGYLCSL